MCSRFEGLKVERQVEPFEINQRYLEDTHPDKVNLSLGVYKNDSGSPCMLPVVRKVEQLLATDKTLVHDYLPVLGLEQFSAASLRFLLGEDNPAIAEGRAFGVQTLSGSGSIRVGAELLFKTLHCDTVYYSDPTFCNHPRMFKDVGFTCLQKYRYWDTNARDLDFKGLVEDLQLAPENSVVVLHACAHNPTGIDPTQEQWKAIADIMEERKLFPFFDSAYQGFASGDLDRDAWAVRYFLQRGFELVCAQSYAKNFGLYNERVGTLTLVVNDAALVPAVKSQLSWIINDLYFNPPAHGARIVTHILTDEQLFDEWKKEIKDMSSRLVKMRRALKAELIKLNTPGNWEHIDRQIGMFSYTGLRAQQVKHLREEYHVYMLRCGRLNVCGLNSGNVEYVAKAIHGAVKKYPAEDRRGSS